MFVPRGPDPDVPAWKILQYMVNHPDPGFTASEIADEFGKTRQWADNRLSKMNDKGYLDSKNPGGRSKWYWPTEAGREFMWQSQP